MTNQEFIEAVAKLVIKYAPSYGIKVHSPIIAQAILESNWGKSKLSALYHNYFGLKCGSSWTGKSVNLSTQEEYTVGTLTTIKDNFRVYDSMEEGIKGYFEFIQLARYQNLKGITDPQEYLETIKADGYATSSTYVANNMKLINQYNLTQYDTVIESEANTMAIKEADIKICGHGSGTPRITTLEAYNTWQHSRTASNGKRKDIVAVKRLKALTDDKRPSFANMYNTIIGRNAYNQSLRNYVYKAYNGKYYSDCSSSGMATYEKIGVYSGYYLNTAGIYNSSLFETVPVNIVDGHITNPEILKVGDALLYIGDDSSRPLQIGHVEFIHTMPEDDNKYTIGWNKDDKGWWYADTTKSYYKSEWKIINHHWYYFNDEGYAVEGWQMIADKWYYFSESGDLECALYHTDENGAQEIWEVG